MDSVSERAVGRAIDVMVANLGEPLTIDDMAASAMFSKFHFTRVFQRVTGVSPGRFLSALRLEEAKKLLVSTPWTVADISHRVGYNSIGTFSSRFKSSVGVSPTEYRRLGGRDVRSPRSPYDRPGGATIHGQVMPAGDREIGVVFIGLFPDRIPQGRPTRCATRRGPGRFVMEHVPAGTWHMMAHSEPVGGSPMLVGIEGPIVVHHDGDRLLANLCLRPRSVFDPPILTAPLNSRALNVQHLPLNADVVLPAAA
ncbi:AraC family transcriptional regulator [Dactylosporangium sp. NPDC049742]|uniref:AraC family transcriptional regulator n=1 Tax=Dactylosporangium sp. NPDC049742 TaxID=3154737 RepID=UPI0034302059